MTSYHGTKTTQSTAARSGPRAGKPPATDERSYVLPLLRAAGMEGINRLNFLQGSGPLAGRIVSQIGRLINTLEAEGFVFVHARRPDSRFVYYVLASEPLKERKPAESVKPKKRGWRDQQFNYGRNDPLQDGLFGDMSKSAVGL